MARCRTSKPCEVITQPDCGGSPIVLRAAVILKQLLVLKAGFRSVWSFRLLGLRQRLQLVPSVLQRQGSLGMSGCKTFV